MNICPFSKEEVHYLLKLGTERFTQTNNTMINSIVIVLINDILKKKKTKKSGPPHLVNMSKKLVMF